MTLLVSAKCKGFIYDDIYWLIANAQCAVKRWDCLLYNLQRNQYDITKCRKTPLLGI